MNHLWSKSIRDAGPVQLIGRYDPNVPAASLRWPLNGVEMMIGCTCLYAEIEAAVTDQAPWTAVFSEDALIARFPLTPGIHWYPILMGMDQSIPHRIAIVNDTQPMEMNGMHSRILSLRSDGTLFPLDVPTYHFEFVGDSLTTGEGCIGPASANEWKSIWMAPSQGYARAVCEEMGARGSLVSQSGWGVYCSWDDNPGNNLPRIYDQLCGVIPEGQIPYPFHQKMDAVIINLGTNDISALKNLPKEHQPQRAEQLKQSTAAFLQKIRQHNPHAYLLWVYGMCGQEGMECFEEGVKMAKTMGMERIGFCALPPCTKEDTGSRMHPGPQNHRKAARIIASHLKNALLPEEKR